MRTRDCLKFCFFVRTARQKQCEKMFGGCAQWVVYYHAPYDLQHTSPSALHPRLDATQIRISHSTLFGSDQLHSSSKSMEFTKVILSLILSAIVQPEGRKITTLQKATFTGNVHLCYAIKTHLLYGVYIYRHLHKLYIIPKYLHSVIHMQTYY